MTLFEWYTILLTAIIENFKDFKSDSEGKLEVVDGKYMMSEVLLKPVITIGSEEDRALAEKVILKSEKACLISNSVKSTISMDFEIIVAKF